MKNVTALDTEFFQHHGKLHRPGGIFACLSVTDGLEGRTKSSLFADKAATKKYLLDLKKSNGVIALQNAPYDLRQLIHHGMWPEGWEPKIWDTMLVEQDLFGGWYQTFSLQALARRWLGLFLSKETRTNFIDANKMTKEMEKYAIRDANVTRRIALQQMAYVENEYDNEFSWYWDVDLPAMWAMLDMKPIRMDVDGWIKHAENMLEEGIAIQEELGFNVKSKPQTFAALKAAGFKLRSDTSLDQAALEGLLESSDGKRAELVTKIMRSRQCRDAHSKYGVRFVEENVENGEWIYPDWKVAGPETGRTACSDPNMQNIRKKGEGIVYRSFFLASEGNELLVADVEQQEPRFSAFLSKDDALRQELIDKVDGHQIYADLFHVDREMGKKVRLSLNYGKSAWGLSKDLGIDVEQVEEILRERRKRYPAYHAWMERQQKQAERLNYVNTVTGRRVWTNPYNYQSSRNAINGPVQGSAGDQTKLALSYIRQLCKNWDVPYTVILEVHDEIVMDIPLGMRKIYRKIMNEAWHEAGHKLMPTIPTEIVLKFGPNWRNTK